MPVHSVKSGKKFKVVDKAGKVYGTHSSQADATAQVQAINIHEGHVPGLKPKKRIK